MGREVLEEEAVRWSGGGAGTSDRASVVSTEICRKVRNVVRLAFQRSGNSPFTVPWPM